MAESLGCQFDTLTAKSEKSMERRHRQPPSQPIFNALSRNFYFF